MSSIYLSLGSNLGDREGNLKNARELLCKRCLDIVSESKVVETPAWGDQDQPDFLNQVLLVDFADDFQGECDPYTLLYICQDIERTMGKVMSGSDGYVKWGPRMIDIDILQYEDIESWDPELRLPHHSVEKGYVKELIAELSI